MGRVKDLAMEQWAIDADAYRAEHPEAGEEEVAEATNPFPEQDEPNDGPRPRENPLQPIFRDHDCSTCQSGRKPCREGNYNNCSNPRARND